MRGASKAIATASLSFWSKTLAFSLPLPLPLPARGWKTVMEYLINARTVSWFLATLSVWWCVCVCVCVCFVWCLVFGVWWLVVFGSIGSIGSIDSIGGIDGIDGIDGVDGVDGIDGIDGIGGIDGINGIDGIAVDGQWSVGAVVTPLDASQWTPPRP